MCTHVQTFKKPQYTDEFLFLHTVPKMLQKLNQYCNRVYLYY